MPISTKAKRNNKIDGKQLLMAVAFLLCVSLGSKISYDFDRLVDFTLQTFAIAVFYYFLKQPYRTVSVLLYLLIGASGIDVFSGGVGWSYMTKVVPSLFFIGFIAASFFSPSKNKTWQSILTYCILVHFIILAFGAFGIAKASKDLEVISNSLTTLIPGAVIKSILAALTILVVNKLASFKKI